LLVDSVESMMMHGLANPKYLVWLPRHPEYILGPPIILFSGYQISSTWTLKLTTHHHLVLRLRMIGAILFSLHMPF